jgi:hypothetical protein
MNQVSANVSNVSDDKWVAWLKQRVGDVVVNERHCLFSRPEGTCDVEVYFHSFLTWLKIEVNGQLRIPGPLP